MNTPPHNAARPRSNELIRIPRVTFPWRNSTRILISTSGKMHTSARVIEKSRSLILSRSLTRCYGEKVRANGGRQIVPSPDGKPQRHSNPGRNASLVRARCEKRATTFLFLSSFSITFQTHLDVTLS